MSDQNEGWDTIEVPSKNEDSKIEFEVEGDSIIDFTETNPFGDPSETF